MLTIDKKPSLKLIETGLQKLAVTPDELNKLVVALRNRYPQAQVAVTRN